MTWPLEISRTEEDTKAGEDRTAGLLRYEGQHLYTLRCLIRNSTGRYHYGVQGYAL